MKTHKNIQRIFALLLSITIAFGVMCVPVNVYAATTDVYTITYHLDGGTNALKNPSAYTAEDTIILLDATKDGYDFAGWFLDSEKTEQVTQISNRTGNLDLYAKFSAKTYTATFNDNGATKSSPLTITLDNGLGTTKTYTVNNNNSFNPYSYWVPTRSGYVFKGWYNGTELVSDKLAITSNLTLNAKWGSCTQYGSRTKPIILGENSKGIFNSGSRFYSEKMTYSYGDLSTECLGSDSSSYGSYGGKHYIYVYVGATHTTLNYEAKYGDVYGDNAKLADVSIYNVTNQKYILNGSGYAYWGTRTGSFEVEPGTLLKIGTGYSIFQGYESHWGQIKLTLGETRKSTISPTNERTVEQIFDTNINSPSVTKTGYKFLGWYDSTGSQITDTWQYTEDQTFTAKWQPQKYTISYELDGSSNNPENPSTYTIEDSITLKAPTKPGYTFKGWYSDADFATQVTSISKKTGNITLYAKFEVNSYNLTLDANEGAFAPQVTFISDGKEIKSTRLFATDSISSYRPDNKEGYIFAGWYKDSSFTSLFKFNGTIKNDLTLYAKWIEGDSNTINPEAPGNYNVTIDGKMEQLYAFVPVADGKITVTSESNNLDLYGSLYDGSKNTLISADDISSNDLDFSYTYDVKAGQLYYISVKGTTALTSGAAKLNTNWTGSCTITGTTYTNRQIPVVFDTNYKLPQKPIREGYVFSGWYDENNTKVTDGKWKFTTDKTLTAKWSTATYHTVTFKNLAGEVISQKSYYLSEDIVAPALPTKAPDKTYTYTAKWDNNYTGVCTGDAVYLPIFEPNYIDYTVTFKNWDGEVISTKTYHYGDKVTAPSTPTKTADNTYTYTFAGWDKTVGNCTGDTTYIATYTPNYINYTVVFKNWNGDILSSKNYHWGDSVTAPATPTKTDDDLHTYTFAGWNKEVVNCDGNATYTATYTKLRKDGLRYVIITNISVSVPDDGSEIFYTVAISDYEGNDSVVTIPATIEDLPVTTIRSSAFENCTTLNSIILPKSISSVENGAFDGCTNLKTVFCCGSKKPSIGTSNTNLSDAKWHCDVTTTTFNGEVVYRCGKCNLLYYADGSNVTLQKLSLISLPNKVSYRTGEAFDITGLSLQGKYANGLTVSLDSTVIETVTLDLSKPGKKTVSVSVAGASLDFDIFVHNAEPASVTVDSSLYPESTHNYSNNLNETKTFTYPGAQSLVITFDSRTSVENNYDYIYIYDGAGKQVAKYTGTTAANKTLTIPGDTFKVKLVSDNSYTYWGYAFSSIKATIENMGEIIHQPVIDPATVTCTQAGLTEGSHCEICGDILVTQEEVDALGHNYAATFDWAEDHASCTATVTCTRNCGKGQTINCTVTINEPNSQQTKHTATAEYDGQVFTDTLTCEKFLVSFVDWDGTKINSTYYHKGDEVIVPDDPTREADDTYTYKFAGWDKAIVNCNGIATYKATYDSTYIDYTVTFKNWDGTILSTKTYHYGDKVTAPTNPTKPADNTYTYKFAGWDKAVVNCNGNTTYTATYDSIYIDYTVTFKNWDGTVLSTKTYHYGDKVTAPTNPTKPADNTYTYKFAGWNKTVVNCVGNATYTARYTHSYIDYTVTFKDWDGTVLSTKTYHYGDKVTAPANPTKPADNTCTYKFAGWDKAVVNCNGNTTYTATYDSIYIDYTVTFKNWDGTILSTGNYHYGDMVNVPINPTKPADVTYAYTFAGWDKEVVNCVGNTTYTAVYETNYIDYVVEFKNWNGDIISSEKYHYGDEVEIPSNPSKETDDYYTYTFMGWDKDITVYCNGNAEYTATFEAIHYHNLSDWLVDVAPSCSADGLKCQICTQCGEILDEDVLPATGHTPSDWFSMNGDENLCKQCLTCCEILETSVKLATPELTKVANTASGVKVTWYNVYGADNYIVYRRAYNTKTKKWGGWTNIAKGVTSTSYLDKTAKSGTYYLYTVRANNEAGLSGYNTAGIKTYFISTPKISSTANTSSAITVKWGKVTGATGYIVYRKTGDGKWQNLGKTTGVSFTDKTAKAGVTYRYTIKAYYGSYVSAYNTNGTAIRRLATPALKSVTSAKSGVTFSWNKVTGATGYIVYRKTGNGGWQKLATVTGNAKISYLDKTAKKGTTYTYTVKAYYGTSTSAYNTKGLTIKDKY